LPGLSHTTALRLPNRLKTVAIINRDTFGPSALA